MSAALNGVEPSLWDAAGQLPSVADGHDRVVIARQHKCRLREPMKPREACPALDGGQLIEVAKLRREDDAMR